MYETGIGQQELPISWVEMEGSILSQLGVEVVLESEVGVDVDVEETGATF